MKLIALIGALIALTMPFLPTAGATTPAFRTTTPQMAKNANPGF